VFHIGSKSTPQAYEAADSIDYSGLPACVRQQISEMRSTILI